MCRTALLVISLLVATYDCVYRQAPYASWAHDHWVWLNGKEQNQTLL